MFNFNGTAMTAMAACVVGLFLVCLIFSFRDTVRGLREFYDVRILRGFARSLLRRTRFSLAVLLLAAMIAPPLLALLFRANWSSFPTVAALAAYLLLLVVPAVIWIVSDLFGRGPRERWRDHL
jgi:hypothetical protein